MDTLRQMLYYLLGKTYLSPQALAKNGPRLLHISDTPSFLFPELARLIKQIKPDYIVHTGDMVDNIKLQLQPDLIRRYERTVLPLLKILDSSDAIEVYITLGNHDNAEYVKKHAGRIRIFDYDGKCTIEGKSISMCHYAAGLVQHDSDFYLFGHDLSLDSHIEGTRIYLNGISNIHLVDLYSSTVKYFSYPWGTDDARMKRHRIGT